MSAKEEYLKEKIDNMPIEELREYCWTIDRLAQTYFEAWQKAEEKIHQLERDLFIAKP
jgi:hypothetical protein